ncbi:MAG: putative DNA-binding domain-containing protein [Roseivivax sp.]|nr:putative DNA-binding domain-containing protein [Roseivivax sp.]
MTTQTDFRSALLDAASPVPSGLTDGAGRPAGRRYAVYRNNVAVSLREALATGFPAIHGLLGETNFAFVAGSYLRAEPPASPLMMHYGAGFPDHLARLPQLAQLAYLPDVARLELALRRAYHAADATPMDPADLAAMEAEALMETRFSLVPAVQLLRSDWPVLDIWRFATLPDQPSPAGGAQDIVVLRPEFDPEPHLLPPGGAAFLTALQRHETLSEALDAAGEAFELAPLLGLLLSNRALAAPCQEATPCFPA